MRIPQILRYYFHCEPNARRRPSHGSLSSGLPRFSQPPPVNKLAAAAILCPRVPGAQCVSTGSTALRACVPSPLMLPVMVLRVARHWPAGAESPTQQPLCRLAAAAILPPLPMRLRGIHSSASVCSLASSALSQTPGDLSRLCPAAALCRLAAALSLCPCQCVSAGSTALRACVPESPLVALSLLESPCPAAALCRLAAAADLGPCQCVSAGSQLQNHKPHSITFATSRRSEFSYVFKPNFKSLLPEKLSQSPGRLLHTAKFQVFFTFLPIFFSKPASKSAASVNRGPQSHPNKWKCTKFFSISAIVSFPKVFATLQDGLVIFPSTLEKKSTPDLHTIFQPREVCVAASWQRPSGRRVRISDPQIFSCEPNARSDQVTGSLSSGLRFSRLLP